MSTGILVLALLAVAATSFGLAASLRLECFRDFLLASYLLAWGEIVVVSLALSPWHAFTRTWLLVVIGLALAMAAVVWLWKGRPSPPPARPAAASLASALRDPVLALLAAAALLGLGYSAALMLGTPVNDFDGLWYHLARAAFWKQQHAVAYIPFPNNNRINAFPPVAEIGMSFTMVLAETDRFVGLAQLAALPATMLGIFAISRRLGLERRPALFGAIVFGTLPVVVLQASTGLNDVVEASFLVIAVYFAFSSSWGRLWLTTLALALAVGTKATALLALPVLALVGAFMHPPSRWPRLLFAGIAGIALGSVWYVVDRVETGRILGARLDTTSPVLSAPGLEQPKRLAFTAGFARMIVDSVDPAGSVGRERLLYGIAAALVLGIGAALTVRRRLRTPLAAGLGAALLLLVAMGFRDVNHVASRAEQRLFLELGSRPLAFVGFTRIPWRASPIYSWYGPLGLVLFLAVLPFVIREVRRDGLPRLGLVLALSPIAFVLLLALFLSYSPSVGRYLMFAVALSCSTWGLLLRYRPLAWGAATVAVVTVVLSFVHYAEKPAGFDVLGRGGPPSVWDSSRLAVQSDYLVEGQRATLAALSERATDGAVIALRIGEVFVSYPYFDRGLERKVLFVGPRGQNIGSAGWLVLSRGQTVPTCPSDWRSTPGIRDGWAVYRRVEHRDCAGKLRT